LFESYGSFLGLINPWSTSILFLSTMLNPAVGLSGLAGAAAIMLSRRLLGFYPHPTTCELVNGLLYGMLVGSLYAPSLQSCLLLLVGCLLVGFLNAVLEDTLNRQLRLPVLGLPYVCAAFIMIPLAVHLQLAPAQPISLISLVYGLIFPSNPAVPFNPSAPSIAFPSILVPSIPFNPLPDNQILSALGSVYFSGTTMGGALVFLAFLISSRYLALLCLGSALASTVFLTAVGAQPGSLSFLVAQMNAVLAAAVVGGLYTVPGKRSIIVAIFACLLACLIAPTSERILWTFGLPNLALPFILATYAVLIGFSPARGGAWRQFWLAAPALPEQSMERMQMAEIRGIDLRSVALKSPVSGGWEVYQGFGGKFTHIGDWHYAIDFFQTQNGRSFANQGKALTDYFCYGKPVHSPAFGTVVDVCTHLPDNAPGEVDTTNNWGNYIIIRLDSGACVVLAHLQKDSVAPRLFTRVFPGEVLAACGNSGRSPQPHLHMHVQEGALLGQRSIPFHLAGVLLTCSDATTYSLCGRPGEGTLVSSPTVNAALKRALHLTVGSRLKFETVDKRGKCGLAQLQVDLDLQGQFWLVSDSGARVAFIANDDLVAFFGRTGPKDLVLDAFILAVGLTPLIEGYAKWEDLVPQRLLPISPLYRFLSSIFHPFTPCAKSDYGRSWQPFTKTWIQSAQHTIGLIGGIAWSCSTTAHLCESLGLVSLEMKENGRTVLGITLVGHGQREDNGIPASCAVRISTA